MQCLKIQLKDVFPFLAENEADPYVEAYLQKNVTAIGREAEKRPCMVVCPGGGYSGISGREAEPIAMHFLPAGFQVFVVRYSVKPHHFPTQLREMAAVMELIHQNAQQWNCDPDRIAVLGFSAGGHLAAHYTNCYDCPQVREVFPDSKPVQACLLGYPVITVQPGSLNKGSFVNLTGSAPEPPEDFAYLSCEKQVSENTPPTFLWHTAADQIVPVNNSLLYAQALAANKVPFELHIYPYGPHGLATVDNQTNTDLPAQQLPARAWLADAVRWLHMNFQM